MITVLNSDNQHHILVNTNVIFIKNSNVTDLVLWVYDSKPTKIVITALNNLPAKYSGDYVLIVLKRIDKLSSLNVFAVPNNLHKRIPKQNKIKKNMRLVRIDATRDILGPKSRKHIHYKMIPKTTNIRDYLLSNANTIYDLDDRMRYAVDHMDSSNSVFDHKIDIELNAYGQVNTNLGYTDFANISIKTYPNVYQIVHQPVEVFHQTLDELNYFVVSHNIKIRDCSIGLLVLHNVNPRYEVTLVNCTIGELIIAKNKSINSRSDSNLRWSNSEAVTIKCCTIGSLTCDGLDLDLTNATIDVLLINNDLHNLTDRSDTTVKTLICRNMFRDIPYIGLSFVEHVNLYEVMTRISKRLIGYDIRLFELEISYGRLNNNLLSGALHHCDSVIIHSHCNYLSSLEQLINTNYFEYVELNRSNESRIPCTLDLSKINAQRLLVNVSNSPDTVKLVLGNWCKYSNNSWFDFSGSALESIEIDHLSIEEILSTGIHKDKRFDFANTRLPFQFFEHLSVYTNKILNTYIKDTDCTNLTIELNDSNYSDDHVQLTGHVGRLIIKKNMRLVNLNYLVFDYCELNCNVDELVCTKITNDSPIKLHTSKLISLSVATPSNLVSFDTDENKFDQLNTIKINGVAIEDANHYEIPRLDFDIHNLPSLQRLELTYLRIELLDTTKLSNVTVRINDSMISKLILDCKMDKLQFNKCVIMETDKVNGYCSSAQFNCDDGRYCRFVKPKIAGSEPKASEYPKYFVDEDGYVNEC